MSESILVKENNGQYQVIGEAEDWGDIKVSADYSIKRIESILGWGEYTAAYSVDFGDYEQTYFVEEDSEDLESAFDAAVSNGESPVSVDGDGAQYVVLNSIHAVYVDSTDGYRLMSVKDAKSLHDPMLKY